MVTFDAAILLEPAENDPRSARLSRQDPCITIGRTPGTPTPGSMGGSPFCRHGHAAADAPADARRRPVRAFVGTTRQASTLETEAAYQLWCEGRQAPVIYYLNEEEGKPLAIRPRVGWCRIIPMWMAFWYWSTPLPAGRVRAFHETATAIPNECA